MRTSDITLNLRKRIVKGEFKPGRALPKRQALLNHYNTSVASFQKCVNQLISEGFIASRGVKGTFVSSTPPSLYQIGIVIPARLNSPRKTWDSFWETFIHEAESFSRTNGKYKFKYYYTSATYPGDMPSLLNDIADDQLAGIFILEHLSLPADCFKKFGNTPTVLLGVEELNYPHVLPIGINYSRMLELGASRLQTEGCTDIAVLKNTAIVFNEVGRDIAGYLAGKGINLPPERIQSICLCPASLATTPNLIRLMFNPEQKRVPDGLVIMNENLLEPVLATFEDLNLVPGKDVHIVSHCNLHHKIGTKPAAERLGIDTAALVRSVVRRISDYQKGLVRDIVWADIIWEEEFFKHFS